MDEFNNKLLLKELAANKEALLLEIEKTEGYVLHNMEQSQVFPPVDFLLEPLNILSLNFLIKNYKLSKDQFLLVNKALRNGSKSSNLISLSELDIEEFIVSKNLLPENVILSKEIINKHARGDFLAQYDLDEYSTDRIVRASLDAMDVDTILSLNEEFLLTNQDHLQNAHAKFSDPRYKALVLSLAKKEPENLTVHNFKNFPFTLEDLPVLKEILKRDNRGFATKYDSLPSSAKALISNVEYLSYVHSDYESFTLAEIKTNKAHIQTLLLAKYKESKRSLWSFLLDLDISLENFKEIIDLPMLTQLTEGPKDYSMRQSHRDSQDSREKVAYLNRLALVYTTKNTQKVISEGKLDLSDDLYAVTQFFERYDKSDEAEEFKKEIENYYLTVLPICFKTANRKETRHIYIERLIKGPQLEFAKKFCQANPSVNLLYFLLSHYHKTSQNKGYDSLAPALTSLIELVGSYIEPKFRKSLYKHFDFSSTNKIVKYLKEKISPSLPASSTSSSPSNSGPKLYNPMSQENNFLNFENLNIDEIEDVEALLLFSVEFRRRVLKNKLAISNSVVSQLMYRLEPSSPVHEFLKSYGPQQLALIKSSPELVSTITSHPLGSTILPPPSEAEEEESFKEILNIIDKIEVRRKAEVRHKEKLKKQKPGSSDSSYYYDKEKSALQSDLRNKTNGLSFKFLSKKISQLLKARNFAALAELSLKGEHSQLIANYIEALKFNDLAECININGFIKILLSFKSENHIPTLRFAAMPTQEKMKIAVSLLKHFDKPTNILHLFGNKDQEFNKSFVINYGYNELFYSYSVLCNESAYSRTAKVDALITSRYTPQEILSAYLNLEKNEGFYANMDVNAHQYQLYRSNFELNKENYLKMLELAKAHPKLYIALLHHDTLCHLETIPEGENNTRISEEKRGHAQFNAHVDIDIVIQGIKEALKASSDAKREYYEGDAEESEMEINKSRQIVNKKLVMESINPVFYASYYRQPSQANPGQDDYLSDMPPANIKKMLTFFLNETPYLLMGLHAFGPYTKLEEHIAQHFGDYIDTTRSSKDIIDSILFPDDNHRPEIFSTQQDSRFADYIVAVVSGMINMFLAQGKMDEVNYIIHVLAQAEFINNSVNYDYRYNAKGKRKNQEIVEFLNDNEKIKELLEVPKSKILIDKILDFKDEPVLISTPRKSNRI